jgi:hypothetical protein
MTDTDLLYYVASSMDVPPKDGPYDAFIEDCGPFHSFRDAWAAAWRCAADYASGEFSWNLAKRVSSGVGGESLLIVEHSVSGGSLWKNWRTDRVFYVENEHSFQGDSRCRYHDPAGRVRLSGRAVDPRRIQRPPTNEHS